MATAMTTVALIGLGLLAMTTTAAAAPGGASGGATGAEPQYPVKVSPNGRYFVDQKGTPVFWLGTTQWQLCRDFFLDDVGTILSKSKATGFTFVQVMLMGVGDGTKPNVHGDKPWRDDNPLTPNEAYFQNVDAVMQLARARNLVISLTLYHQTNRKFLTAQNARAWAKWVAQRYRDVPTLVWAPVPEAKAEYVPVLRELAAGLREGDGGAHLITCEPDPSPHSSSFIHEEKWLDYNSIQTWRDVQIIYPMVTKDYGLQPVKPVVMVEGAYERGSEYGFDVTPLWVRRQAYYSYLGGAHHAYGHNDSWRLLPTWKQALDAPGAAQLGILKKVFMARKEWWNLVPDQALLTSGGEVKGQVLNLAARHKDGLWIMAYLGAKASFSLNVGALAPNRKAMAFWVDPRDGHAQPIGPGASREATAYTTPEGWEDALLIVETSE